MRAKGGPILALALFALILGGLEWAGMAGIVGTLGLRSSPLPARPGGDRLPHVFGKRAVTTHD